MLADGTGSLWSAAAQLYHLMSPERRRQLLFVILLMLLGAVAEVATIGALVPLLAILADPLASSHFPALVRLIDGLSNAAGISRVAAAAMVFSVIAIAAGTVRLQLAWSQQSLIFKLGHDVAVTVNARILAQPYSFHIGADSSRLVTFPEKVQTLVFDLLTPLLHAIAGAILGAFIFAALILLDPVPSIIGAAAFGGTYLAISAATRGRLARNSAAIGHDFDERAKIVRESLGGIRDVIIDGSQATFVSAFRSVDERLNRTRTSNIFIGLAPRFILEALGMVVIALIATVLAGRPGGLTAALPMIGALALGAQRLLPLVQQIYHGWALASGNQAIVGQLLELAELPHPHVDENVPALPLRRAIEIDRVNFAYPGRSTAAIGDLSLKIPAGTLVGLIGPTGGGKSTLVDLLMGLLEPDDGAILVDGVPITPANRARWWRSIAHVPQAIYLADLSIARNIAFGVDPDRIDLDRVRRAAGRAQLGGFIDSLPEGYDTLVGDRGIRLSGGQRQRIGIARALYKDMPLIVLDEATSALDEATELAVMDQVAALARDGRTVIIIAHRLSTIARCSLVAEIKDGRLVRSETFDDSRQSTRTAI